MRQAAAEHAAEWSDPDLAGALVALLDDPDRGVAAAATAALARIPDAARRHALARIENEARAAREQGYHLLATVGGEKSVDHSELKTCRAKQKASDAILDAVREVCRAEPIEQGAQQ